MKKPKVLTDIECMSGTGWYPDNDDIELDCTECGEVMYIDKDDTAQCSNGHKFKIERGTQYMVKVGDLIAVDQHLSKECQRCTYRDCGDYDDCHYGHNYIRGIDKVKKKRKRK